MRRALEEYRIMGLKTNIPFHQNMLDSHRFLAGSFDTTFVEERFSLDKDESSLKPEIAAILATLAAHRDRQQAAQIVQQDVRSASNWKWAGRYRSMLR